MLRILVSFWIVMTLGGLAVQYLFGAVGLAPTSRPIEIAPTTFALDYTAALNIIFLGLFAVLYYLHHHRTRFGGGVGYATDPVCGMQVETASAPARVGRNGVSVYFCSDHCRERFERRPATVAR